MRLKHILAAATAAIVAVPASASAAVIIVDAKANSSTNGVAKSSGPVFLTGQNLRVRSSINDLWSAGALPRFSDGSGLTGNRNAAAGDDSGVTPGTQIGSNFGSWTQAGHSAPFGALVGRYADGTFQTFGANFTGAATGTGALDLFYWDSNNADNAGEIAFNIAAGIPEPATWAMMIMGFGLVGSALRQAKGRTATRVRFA